LGEKGGGGWNWNIFLSGIFKSKLIQCDRENNAMTSFIICKEKKQELYRVWAGKPEGKRQLGRMKRRK
jgi:hypothetical protein